MDRVVYTPWQLRALSPSVNFPEYGYVRYKLGVDENGNLYRTYWDDIQIRRVRNTTHKRG